MNMHPHVEPGGQVSGAPSAPPPKRAAGGLRRPVAAGLLALALLGAGTVGAIAHALELAPEPMAAAAPTGPAAATTPDPTATPTPLRASEPAPAPSPIPTQAAPAQPTPRVELDGGLLLPDLEMVTPESLYIEVDRETGDRAIRFDTTVANLGQGPLELVGTYDPATDQTRAIQRIRTRAGGVVERFVGSFVFHPGHSHWHFEDFTAIELWSHGPDGSLEELEATTDKMTFCLMDSERVEASRPGVASRGAFGGCGQGVQGISVGWADVYGPTLPGQELDISGVPDGRYAVRSTADPDNRLPETDETNNTVIAYVEIRGTSIAVLGEA